jgi:hypothetical protein
MTTKRQKQPLTGFSVNYYKVQVEDPTSGGEPYMAECNDIIEALNMDYAEANQFKSIWRRCAARTLGLEKPGIDAIYDAEKSVFFAGRSLRKLTRKVGQPGIADAGRSGDS